tara:strand:+ start:4903 stop:5097 length:195 start_codon:yes stop_codon:yes gene_type:complete
MRLQGNFSFPSAHEAKAYCWVLFFLVQSKILKILRPNKSIQTFGISLDYYKVLVATNIHVLLSF